MVDAPRDERNDVPVSTGRTRPIVPLASDIAARERQPSTGPVGVAVIGSTGSVGLQTLDVLAHLGGGFTVSGLVANRSRAALADQARTLRPAIVGIDRPVRGDRDLFSGTTVLSSEDAMMALAVDPATDIVVVASSGHAAIRATLAALDAGKVVALANKEAIVCAGPLVVEAIGRGGGQVRPVDSEHSAIWQSIGHSDGRDISRLILTASGGPFRTTPLDELREVTVAQALAHPTWRMGGKITIDSATLVNKGLELIEAGWLFGVPADRLDVVVHPESVVHSLVEFADRSQIAQLSLPDMRLPIQYALTWPEHRPSPGTRLSLADLGQLTFERPDRERFPALDLALDAMRAGSTFPTVLSAADEVAVAAFIDGRLSFLGITAAISAALDRHVPEAGFRIETILAADAAARRDTERWIAAQT